eukprot:1157549-Pelagomonas_calceolata.AAC.2
MGKRSAWKQRREDYNCHQPSLTDDVLIFGVVKHEHLQSNSAQEGLLHVQRYQWGSLMSQVMGECIERSRQLCYLQTSAEVTVPNNGAGTIIQGQRAGCCLVSIQVKKSTAQVLIMRGKAWNCLRIKM